MPSALEHLVQRSGRDVESNVNNETYVIFSGNTRSLSLTNVILFYREKPYNKDFSWVGMLS